MTIADLAWAAGIIEGEGCMRWKVNQFGHGTTDLTVTQKDVWILEKLQSIFGGKIYYQVDKRSNCSHRHLGGKSAKGVIFTLFSWFSPRRRTQARKALGN